MTTADELHELATRVSALEERIDQESGLRASQDRDLASLGQTLRAQHHTLQALSLTQSDHNLKIDRLEAKLTAGLTQIIGMLERLEGGETK